MNLSDGTCSESSIALGGLGVALSRSEAGTRVQRLRVRLGELRWGLESVDRLAREVLSLVVELHEGQAWRAYGLANWDALVEAERLRMPGLGPDEELAAVRFLLENHFTHRAVASVLGFSGSTVSRKRSVLEGQGVVFPARVRSLDGKVRSAVRAEPGSVIGEVLPGQMDLPLEATGPSASAAEVAAFLKRVEEAPLVPGEAVGQIRVVLEEALLPAMEQLEAAVSQGMVLPERVQSAMRALDGRVEQAYQRWRAVSLRGAV